MLLFLLSAGLVSDIDARGNDPCLWKLYHFFWGLRVSLKHWFEIGQRVWWGVKVVMIKAGPGGICNLCKRARRTTAKEESHWIHTKEAQPCSLGSLREEGTQTERRHRRNNTWHKEEQSMWDKGHQLKLHLHILARQIQSLQPQSSCNHSFIQYFTSVLPCLGTEIIAVMKTLSVPSRSFQASG